jgi:simple sugar transport system permease protein
MIDVVATLQGTLTLATPLLLAALGESVTQKSGVVNVGLEGMMLVGAFAAVLSTIGATSPWMGLVSAALAGVALAALFALFAVRLAANQVVVGVVINLLALGLTGTIYRARFGETGTFLSVPLLPKLFLGENLLVLFALLGVPLLWYWLNRTRTGLLLRACGEQPTAAEAAGTSVLRVRFLAVLFGGAMTGLAGASLSIGTAGTFIENMTAGRGFIALAIVTSGRWNAFGCLIAAVVFGFVEQLQFLGQAQGWKLPYQLFLALPYVVTLLILVGGGKQTQAPASLGRPYRRV